MSRCRRRAWRRRTALLLLVTHWLLGAGAPAWAQDEPANDGGTVVVEGGEAIVEADSAGPAGPLSSSGYLPGARTLIGREQFQETQRTAADVLQTVPGVTVTRSGDALAPAKVSIRGSRPDQVLILIDGVPQVQETSDPAQGRLEGRQGIDLSRLSLEQVESIEVIRGAATGLYGPGAAAGAVLIRTRAAAERRLEVSASVGTGGVRMASGTWDEPLDEGALSTHVTYRHSEGRYLFYDPDLDGANRAVVPGSERCAPVVSGSFRERRCNERTLAGIDLTWRRAGEQRWRLGLEAEERLGLGGVENPRPHGEEQNRRLRLGFADTWSLDEGRTVGLTLDGAAREATRTDNADDPAVPRTRQQERQAFADGWWEQWREGHQWRLGGSHSAQTLEDRNFDAARDQSAAYARWRRHLARGTLEAALRYDAFVDIADRGTYRLGASHFVAAHAGVKASHGTGYRPPTLYELYDPGSDLGPSAANPDLAPEDSRSWDAGVFWDAEPALYTELQAFEQVQDNAIVLVARDDLPAQFRFENLTRTRTTGVEAALGWRPGPAWRVDLSASLSRPRLERNDRIDPRDNGNDVPGIPREQWSAGVRWEREGWWASAGSRHRGRRYIDTANTRFLTPYTVTDVAAGMPLPRGFSLALEVNNLTNETHADLENFPAPGRQLLLTLRWRHGGETAPPAGRGATDDSGGERGD